MTTTPFGESPFGPYEYVGDSLVEFPGQPGVATELTAQVDDAIGRWAEYADDTGWIQLSTFDGATVNVRRGELKPDGLTHSYDTVAVGGLAGWFARRRNKTHSRHYDIQMDTEDGRTDLNGLVLLQSGDSTQVSGQRTIETPDGPVEISLRPGLDLEEAAQRAANVIKDGFPMSAEAAIAARQAKPCETIVGNEAVAIQKVIEGLVASTTQTGLGDKNSPQQISQYEIVEPRVDGQWSVKSLTAILRAGTVIPTIQGVEGRSVITFINFSGQTVNSIDETPLTAPLLVGVEGVYEDGTNRLVGAQVGYYTEGNGQGRQVIAVSPEDRKEIHEAISRQVVPGNVVGGQVA